ncbi:dihydrolipoyllysine-residue acetyltransferase [Entomomonas asaccharolytica]|uniref:Acetyltransferase component of pyruvate dehydrogenase complex n=1 Tax=Entomomonas asaccharolytica TaxID=2785331 RepID=A0A974NE04_9GAMM|nr:dihydrolipoyllysine-residue acetyltransferase [Entomomonas asaccharolytica]QQP84916.1 dihydrolipoyllysine-residue acetyltransferase [Entomomonas asaccharolytica]
MSETIHVPNIGGEGEVIEILVKVGDRIEAEQSIVTLESAKASMEVPSVKAGVVKKILFKMGDTLKEGDPMLELETEGSSEAKQAEPAKEQKAEPQQEAKAEPKAAAEKPAAKAKGGVEQINVPNIGGEGEVIEILVKVGDRVEAEQSIVTLESAKASMEVPTPKAGIVKKLLFKMGDSLKDGDPMLELEVEGDVTPAPAQAEPAKQEEAPAATPKAAAQAPATKGGVEQINVPNIGGEGEVIEILVKVGDKVEAEQSIVTLESAKASMEVPTPKAGIVKKLLFKMGDSLKDGDPMLELEVEGDSTATDNAEPAKQQTTDVAQTSPSANQVRATATATAAPASKQAEASGSSKKVHAGPAVRMIARDFGVDLAAVKATGPRGRILKEDVQSYVKQQMQQAKSGGGAAVTGGSGIPPIPEVDFSRFGEIEEVAMTRLMQIAAVNLHRSWVNVPHVTQFDQSDITELEAFRVAQKALGDKKGVKLTLLPFLIKACAYLLLEMPDFNSSLVPSGKALIRKKYVHIGFAVDTPDGLLVPVIRDADKKSLFELAKEAADLAAKARDKKLKPDEMQGACFTISSLGHIGGTGFTPIVNAPEVAILGVNKATMQPVWDGKGFQPRLMLPLSLSYDHRVINGAAAARFTKRLADVLADIRSMLL